MNIRLHLIDIFRQVDESSNVDSELSKDGSNDVHIEDVWLRALLRKTLDRLGMN